MDFKKIRKGSNNLTSLMISLLLVLGIFFGLYYFLSYNASSSGVSLGNNYTNSITSLNNSQNLISDNIGEIKSNIQNITEAESGFIVAINGFRGLGNILKLPISFVTIVIQIYDALSDILHNIGIPKWITILFSLGLVGYVVFLILSILKGEQQKV